MSAVTTITMPQLGETVTEGTITRWLKNVGDPIEKYEAFAEVATDKVNAEIPSPTAGILLAILVPEGETVPTGAEIARIGTADAQESATTPDTMKAAADAATAGAATPGSPAAPQPEIPQPAVTPSAMQQSAAPSAASPAPEITAAQARELRLSPAVRRELRKTQLDPANISGTGDNRRITLRDVQNAASQTPGGFAQNPPSRATAAPVPAERGSRLMPLSRARKTIAEHMVQAVRTIPHAWTMVEADVTGLVARRHAEQQSMRATLGFAPTYFQYFAHAVVATLAEHPLMNSRYTDTGIEIFSHVDLCFAIALPENLVVPVVRDAHRMRFDELSSAIAGVTDRARKGKLAIDELRGGTITINNTGANGSILSTPIINGGQAAIITMESIVKRPVVVHHDAVAVRSMVNICCSIDHRAIDGDVVGSFLRHLKLRLQAYNENS